MKQLQTTEYDRLIAHYANVKRRINTAGKKPALSVANVKVFQVKEYVPPSAPEWKRQQVLFDSHVTAWRMLALVKAQPRKQFVMDRCKVYGVNYDEIVGYNKMRKIALARQIIQWELKREFPDVSMPDIGRMFGGRDHTTIYHALKKVDALVAKGELIFRE